MSKFGVTSAFPTISSLMVVSREKRTHCWRKRPDQWRYQNSLCCRFRQSERKYHRDRPLRTQAECRVGWRRYCQQARNRRRSDLFRIFQCWRALIYFLQRRRRRKTARREFRRRAEVIFYFLNQRCFHLKAKAASRAPLHNGALLLSGPDL